MASDADYLDYVCEQAGLGTELTHRRMFGEYALYLHERLVALVCDNELFVKPTDEERALLGEVEEGLPYPGARPHLKVAELLDDPELLRRLLLETARVLPLPKPRRATSVAAPHLVDPPRSRSSGSWRPASAPHLPSLDEEIRMQIQPYLFFDGRCEEAVAFYRDALGAQVLGLMHYSDAPQGDAGCPGGTPPPADKVMHACLQIGQTQVMASDGFASGHPEFKGVALSITADDDAQARQLFDALAAGGQVQQPLGPSFFASSFGMVADRFGVSWMVVAGMKG